MATYHLRVKDDTKRSALKSLLNVMLIIFYARKGKPMRIISIEKEHRATVMIVSSKEVSYRNGQKARLKNFFLRRLVTRTKETVATKKSNYLCLMN